ncbi:HNH endonuclease signature motif containing protein [Aeromicrobium fastidiosum]|uniref:DUF222 domain-containing protein n=1 Tax=Aeromicrobium fastidiosum TaxID=52699 RepID=A0A641ASE4_9ACTN|nr:HNH endonuclease signature motif containing protein [Aeromicrobium fastidiosum]KAA1380457.1 DUF222 domain-containing protein [Aeromicrobium fastidiosum]MBP2390038.1 hypothetical protein [Aeromicrobium fastidiosum]
MFESTMVAIAEALDALRLDVYDSMQAADQMAACERLARLEARVKAHLFAATRAADASKAAKAVGATSTGAALATMFGGDEAAAARMVKRANKVQAGSATEKALASGELSEAQADLIADKLGSLPGNPSEAQREGAETQLLDDAKKMSLKDLGRRADRISDTFADDDEVDAHEDKTLRDRETEARKKSYFWMADRKDGTYKGEFVIPEAQAEMLKNALEALNAPQVKKTDDDLAAAIYDAPPTYGQQMAEAFCTFIEHIPGGELPQTAGVGVTVSVSIELRSLIDGLKAGTLTTGCRVSAAEVRRMACEQAILPMVFDGAPLPLDCGREKRLFTRAQRRAAEGRDGGCTFPGCTRPPSWCVGHHARKTWAAGGTTDLHDMVLICPHHHRIVHAQDWDIVFADDGRPEYIPPAAIDPERRPRRNHRFRADRSDQAA